MSGIKNECIFKDKTPDAFKINMSAFSYKSSSLTLERKKHVRFINEENEKKSGKIADTISLKLGP